MNTLCLTKHHIMKTHS